MNLIIKTIGLGATAINISGFTTYGLEKSNILWIVADDLGPDLGCYGNRSVSTPSIDKLASEGVKFTELHSVVAVCSPSRSSLITGMFPVSINCHQHRTYNKKVLPEGILPVTEYFRQAGYYVCNGNATVAGQPGKTDYNFEFGGKTIFDLKKIQSIMLTATHWIFRRFIPTIP
jgi:arylsulfatase A-like enzyme